MLPSVDIVIAYDRPSVGTGMHITRAQLAIIGVVEMGCLGWARERRSGSRVLR